VTQQRFIGVARPPDGAAADPPRAVIDLTGRPEPPPRSGQRKRRTVVAPHRRRVSPTIWRGFELAAWVGCIAVVVTVAVVLATGADVFVRWREPPSAAAATTDCAFRPCAPGPIAGEPHRLRITSLGVDAPLEVLELDRTGELKPPTSYDQPGWYGKGTAPGDIGPAVIAGHVDSTKGPAIFYELDTVQVGDVIEVERGGQWVAFRVYGTQRYAKEAFPSDRVYGLTPDAELRLITCGGEFDPTTLSYRDNIVVYAIIIRS
jgi:Sortase domain